MIQENGTLENIHKNFMAQYAFPFSLPERITAEYDIITCLKDTQDRYIYLLQSKADGSDVLLKCGRGQSRQLIENEYRIAEQLSKEAVSGNIIRPIKLFTEGDVCCLLREYIRGSTLEMTVETESLFRESEAVELMAVLCDIVDRLHRLEKPIICRDINPSNILIAADGSVKIIDLDSAKRYDKTADHDEFCMGTREVAAPEQYGASCSDFRTDVYLLGKLLTYITTGDYDSTCIKSPHIRQVVERCTAADPAARYSTVAGMKAALTDYKSE